MSTVLAKIVLFWKRLLSYFPSKLPVGMTEFETWCSEIIDLSGKYADETSLKFAIATMVLHAESKFGSLPKNYFVVRLRKVAANQVAGQVFQDIKEKQAAAQAASQAKIVTPTAEDTATPVASNVQPG